MQLNYCNPNLFRASLSIMLQKQRKEKITIMWYFPSEYLTCFESHLKITALYIIFSAKVQFFPDSYTRNWQTFSAKDQRPYILGLQAIWLHQSYYSAFGAGRQPQRRNINKLAVYFFFWTLILVCWSSYNKMPHIKWLKHQTFFFSDSFGG